MPVEVPETIEVEDTRVACDGGGALGHPRVFWRWVTSISSNAPIATAASCCKDGAKTH